MPYNEADTCVKLINPKLYQAGWNEERIRREQGFTDGRIYLIGETHKRRKRKIVDYLLHYSPDMPLAVVEAKDESHAPGDGMQQAKDYAELLGLKFAYATNGHGIEEFDFITNRQRSLKTFPSPQELWQRYQGHRWQQQPAIQEKRVVYTVGKTPIETDPLLYPYNRQGGKSPRYYQEVAIRRVIQAFQNGQQRMLLTMATGTGKTYTAFQIVWKLLKTGFIKRVLFLADRNVLRDQAYRAFGSFEDMRAIISGEVDLNRQIYFGIYQALYGTDTGRRLYLDFPPDFFDVVIIDECHRSGFGTWHDILKHFDSAIHLGMTATPKRTDNIDTYKYFCQESDGESIYEYKMGQAIDDGFLATYRVHRVWTNIDKDGLHVEDAKTQGAEFFIPSGADLRDEYQMQQFEREIVLPDRTKIICRHLANLLRQYGPRQKTIVFCVTMEHAALVAKELQNSLGQELGIANYAQRIVSAERNAETYLEQFRSSESPTPVVATTADLLETGVDIPSVKNIVFLKPVQSTIVFKQIVGRGSRLDSLTNKYWFRIIDYTNATRLFESWDRPDDVELPVQVEGPRENHLRGMIVAEETGQPIAGVLITVLVAVNEQIQTRTGPDGAFSFDQLPAGQVKLIAQPGPAFRTRQITVTTNEDTVSEITVALPSARTTPLPPIEGRGVKVFISEETYLELDATGKQLSVEAYINHAALSVQQLTPNLTTLLTQWQERHSRQRLRQQLGDQGVDPAMLAVLLKYPEADPFDTLAHVAFQSSLRSREERAQAMKNQHQDFFQRYQPECRIVLENLIDMYRLGGIEALEHPSLFDTPLFVPLGRISGVIKRCGGPQHLRAAMDELQRTLYQM